MTVVDEREKDTFRKLLDQIADRGSCIHCGADVWFVETRRGRVIPVEYDGMTHTARCPHAGGLMKRLERKRKGEEQDE
jgi:hypothetical protein